MDEILRLGGWLCFGQLVLALIGALGAPLVVLWERFKLRRTPQVAGAELPAVATGIDLSKRYDIAYGSGNGYGPAAGCEKLLGVRILGYLRGERDATTGEYGESRWLVAELPDGRRAYLRPRCVLWLLESQPAETALVASRPGQDLTPR